MKRIVSFAFVVTCLLSGCSQYDHALADLEDKVVQIESLSLTTMEEQLALIEESVADLGTVDEGINEYIENLEGVSEDLEGRIESISSELEALQASHPEDIADLDKKLMDELKSVKTSLESQLASVNSAITTLTEKDTQLSQSIADLKKYAEDGFTDTKDWVANTYATLDQYATLQQSLSEVSTTVENLVTKTETLKTDLEAKMTTDIKTAVDALRTEVTDAYGKAIDDAVQEISDDTEEALGKLESDLTTAYKTDLADAISDSEAGMRQWVNDKLQTDYYTIAQTEAQLALLKTELSSDDDDLQGQITSLEDALVDLETELTEAYKAAIKTAIDTNNGVIEQKIADAVDAASNTLQSNIDALEIEIDAIKVELGLLTDRVSALETRIQSIRFLPEYSDGKVELSDAATLKFILAPKEAAGEVTVGHVTAFISQTKDRTKAVGEPVALTVESVSGDAATGVMEVVVSAASLPADFWTAGDNANMYICISDGNNDIISEMIPTFHVPYVTIATEVMTKAAGGNTLKMSAVVNSLEYSTDGGATWNELGTNEVAFGNGIAVLLRGKAANGTGNSSEYATIQITGEDVVCYGDIRTLINWENHTAAETANASFYGLFKGCDVLVDASELKLIPDGETMADECYSYMFSGCTSMTEAPELPATELSKGCYSYMFSGCTSMTEAPELPAPVLTEDCYKSMFAGCTELDNVTISATDASAPGCIDGMLEDVELSEPSEIVAVTAEDLVAKISEVPAGSTIRLGADITVQKTIVVTKDLTIDGNDNTLTFTAVDNLRMVEVSKETEGASLTLKNVTLLNNVSYVQRGVNYNTNGTLTLDNVTIESADGCSITYAVNCPGSSDNATIEINKSCITGLIALNLWGENTTANVVDSELYNCDKTDVEDYATIVLNNDGETSAKGSVLTISGGKISATDQNAEPCTVVSNPALGTVTISETTEVIGHIRNNVAIVDYGTNEHYGCLDLGEAIEQAMNTNGSVRLLTDIELEGSITIPAGKVLTLDLNGYTISQEYATTTTYAMIVNKGTFTIKDRSSEKSGKISYKDITEYTADVNYASNTIRNEGTLTLEAGTIENISGDDVMDYGYPHVIDVYQGSTTNIKGGTVKSANYDCIRMFCNSTTLATTVNISGGNIINRVSFQNPTSNTAGYGRLNITGGTFTSTDNITANVRLLNFSSDISNMKAVISGGTFDKGVKTQNYGSATVNTADWLTIENDAIQEVN